MSVKFIDDTLLLPHSLFAMSDLVLEVGKGKYTKSVRVWSEGLGFFSDTICGSLDLKDFGTMPFQVGRALFLLTQRTLRFL